MRLVQADLAARRSFFRTRYSAIDVATVVGSIVMQYG